jgi:hypothetical protein
LLVLVLLIALLPLRRRTTPSTGVKVGVLLPLVVGGIGLILTAGVLGGIVVAAAISVVALRAAAAHDRARGRVVDAPSEDRAALTSLMRRWGGLIESMIPAAFYLLATALWLVVYRPHMDWKPYVTGFLAIGVLWLTTILRWHPSASETRAGTGTSLTARVPYQGQHRDAEPSRADV